MIDYRVYLVTDDPSRYTGDWLANVEAAIAGGVTCVQYRDTESDPASRLLRAHQLKDLLSRSHTPLIINNDPYLARTVKAEGVHVGQHDMPPENVREIVGPDCEIGLSITSISDVKSLNGRRACVDSIGIGPIFDATATKRDASAAIGLDGLKDVVSATSDFANCAIGGITLANAADVIAAGAKGIALVSAFSKSENPNEVARNLKMLFDHCRQ